LTTSAQRPSISSSVRARIRAGAIANLLDKGSVTLVQIIWITVLARQWGAEGYGTWLMLMTIPSYLLLTDFGLSAAVGTKLTALLAKGQQTDAAGLVKSARRLLNRIICGALCLTALSAWAVGSLHDNPSLAISFLAIVGYAGVIVRMSLTNAIYRAAMGFAFAMRACALLILIEAFALLAIVGSGGDMPVAACALLVVRLIGADVLWRRLIVSQSWMSEATPKHAPLRALLRPSLGAFALNGATILLLQGTILMLGWKAGAAAVAIYGATRTLCRVPLQLSGVLVRPLLPELTASQSTDRHDQAHALGILNIKITAMIGVPLSVGLAMLGPDILHRMSGLESGHVLFLALGFGALMHGLWMALASPLIAQNLQARFAFHYVGIACLALGALFLWHGPVSANAVAFTGLVAEFLMLGVILAKSRTVQSQ